MNDLVNAAANRDSAAFQAAYTKLKPGDPNWKGAYNDTLRTVLEEQARFDANAAGREAAAAVTATNPEERNRHIQDRNNHLTNGMRTTDELSDNYNDQLAQRRFVAEALAAANTEGERQGLSAEQIATSQQDALVAAVNLGFDLSAVVGGAVDAGVAFHPPSPAMRSPMDDSDAQNILDVIRYTAMLQSGERMRSLMELDRRMTGERDPRTRAQMEEEYRENSRELTRLMGREGSPRGNEESGQVRISTGDVNQIVDTHLKAVIAMHTGHLEDVVVSKRPPQMQA